MTLSSQAISSGLLNALWQMWQLSSVTNVSYAHPGIDTGSRPEPNSAVDANRRRGKRSRADIRLIGTLY